MTITRTRPATARPPRLRHVTARARRLVLIPRAKGDGWQTHRSCSSCAPCSGNCGCSCHTPVSSAPAQAAA